MMSRVTPLRKAAHIQHGFQLVKNRKTLWAMLKDVWKGRYKLSFYTTFVIIMGLLYVILPFDFDWIPFLGWLDDGFIIFLVFKRLQKETQRYIRAKVMERKGDH